MNNVRAVNRAIQILKTISLSERGLTVTELSIRLDLHSTTVIRLLATLENEGIVARDLDTLAYNVGPVFLEMAAASLQCQNISSIAIPVMQDFAKESEETIALFVINGMKRVCVDKIEGLHPIRWHIAIGDSAPLGISSSGKLLLAFASNSLIESVVKKPLILRDGTIVNPEDLKKELELIKSQGYATSFCENSVDGAGISAPIKNSAGKVIASLTLLGPVNRITSEKIEKYKEMAIDAANKISMRL